MSVFGSGSSSQGGGLFGGNNTATSGTGGTNTTQPSIFGTKPAMGGGLFGGGNTNTNTTGTSTGGSLFGGATGSTQTSGGLFGGSSSSTTPLSGLFGATNTNMNTGTSTNATTPTTSTTAPTSTNVFGGGGFSLPKPTGQTVITNTTTPAATSTAGPTSTNLFGGGNFSLPKPTEQSGGVTAPKPAGSSLFGQPSTTATGSTPATGGGLFGLPPKPTDGSGATSTNTPAPSGGLFGSGSLFGKTSTTATTSAPSFSLGGSKEPTPATTTTPAATPAPTGGLFGNLGGASKPAEKKDSTTPVATTPAPAFGLFGAKTEEKKDGAAQAASNFGLPASKDTTKPVDNLGLTTAIAPATSSANATIAVAPPSMLRGKTIEEIVNRWSTELETHVREFNRFAGEVSVWDRALVENGNNLAALYGHVQAAEREQNEIDQSLDHIEQQQKELDSTLAAYEKVTQEILGSQGGSLKALDTGPADTERDKNYTLATDLHTHLDDLSGSLTQMIDSVNALSLPPNDPNSSEDPMSQIAQILSSHLESLQWIDGAVREVDSKVSEVEKRVKGSGHGNPNGTGQKSRGFGLNR